MNRKTTTGFIKKVYILLACCILVNYLYSFSNGLQNKPLSKIQPTAVSINYNLNSIIAIVVIFSFFYFVKSVKYSTRSIR